MATTPDVIRDRMTSLCASAPFSLTEALTPFDFDKQPSGQIDQVFRVTSSGDQVIGGFNFSEERQDRIEIWVARKQTATPQAMYTQLLSDAQSLRAAVVRDGATSGLYSVPNDLAGMSIDHENGASYAVLRVTLAANYETDLS